MDTRRRWIRADDDKDEAVQAVIGSPDALTNACEIAAGWLRSHFGVSMPVADEMETEGMSCGDLRLFRPCVGFVVVTAPPISPTGPSRFHYLDDIADKASEQLSSSLSLPPTFLAMREDVVERWLRNHYCLA